MNNILSQLNEINKSNLLLLKENFDRNVSDYGNFIHYNLMYMRYKYA